MTSQGDPEAALQHVYDNVIFADVRSPIWQGLYQLGVHDCIALSQVTPDMMEGFSFDFWPDPNDDYNVSTATFTKIEIKKISMLNKWWTSQPRPRVST